MTLSKEINLASAVLGRLGVLVLYKGSFAYERPATWDEDLDAMFARNCRRHLKQRISLAFIAAAFVLQMAAQFID